MKSLAPRPERGAAPHPLLPLVCYSALALAQQGLGLLLLPLYLTHLSPAEYGVLAIVAVASQLIAVVSSLKLDAAMRTFQFDHDGDPQTLRAYVQQIFSAAMLLGLTTFALMLVVGDTVFAWAFANEAVSFFPIGALALAAACIGTALSPFFVYLRNALRLRELVGWQLLILAGTVSLQLVLVVGLDLGLTGVLWGALLPQALALALICLTRPELITLRLQRKHLEPSLRYALPLAGLGLLVALGARFDRLVLERNVDLTELGAYALLLSLLGLSSLVLNVIDNTVRPYLYPALRAGGERAARASEALARVYMAAGLLALSVAVLFGANLHVLTDDPAYLSMRQWLALGATAFVPSIFTRYYALFYDFHKRSIDMSLGVVARSATVIALMLVLVPALGVRGALLALLFAGILGASLLWLGVARRLPVAPPRPDVMRPLAFVASIWLLQLWLGADQPAAYGVVQLGLVLLLVFTGGREALASLGKAIAGQRMLQESSAQNSQR